MKPAIIFHDYETISDTLLQLGQGAVLKMAVQLASKSKDNERTHMSQEYLYRTNKYVNKDKVVSVKRKFFPYLSIEYKDDIEIMGKKSIQITHYDIIGFQRKVLEVDGMIENSYAIKKGKIIIPADKNFEVKSMPSDSIITFGPSVLIDESGNTSPGVRLGLNNRVFINMPIKTWKAFVYYIQTADLYGWAVGIVSGYTQDSIGTGINDMQKISRDPSINEEPDESFGFKRTKPVSKEEKRKNFFDD